MDHDQTRDRLRQLGADQLADTLMALAETDATALDIVSRMTAAKSDSLSRYQVKLRTLSSSHRFITGQGVYAFCEELEQMLLDLQAGVEDAETGFDLITAFFEADKAIFEQCDDSSGAVGDVFRYSAANILVQYGEGCADQARVVARLVALYGEDDYGIREILINVAHRFLSSASLRVLAEQLWERAQHAAPYSFAARHWLLALASVARQLHDAPLFEQAQCAMHADLPAAVHIDIAEAYFDAGNAVTARAWLERMPEHHYVSVKRDALLLKVSKHLGDTDTAAQIAWRMYDTYHSEESLQTLLAVIGKEQRNQVVEQTVTTVLRDELFSTSDALFLTHIGRIAEAETYLLAHAEQLDGDAYYSLGPLAECMEQEERWLAASLIYRALTESTLRRAVSKYYHHGVRYLQRLDVLAAKITDWQAFPSHTAFVQRLQSEHKRKTGFWSKYIGS